MGNCQHIGQKEGVVGWLPLLIVSMTLELLSVQLWKQLVRSSYLR